VVIVGVACHFLVPESPVRSGGRVNWAASALLATWLVALLLPVSEGQAWGWGSPATLVPLAVAAIAFAAWVVVESHSSSPVIDMRMMRKTAVWTTNLVALLFGAAMFSVLTFLPQFIETPRAAGYGFGSSVTMAGVIIFKAQLGWGSAFLGAGSLGFAFWNAAAWQVAIGGAVFGFGLGLAYSAMTSVIVQSVPPAQTGVAAGMNTNIRNIGGAIGTAVVTATARPDGLPTASGYAAGFTVLAAIAALPSRPRCSSPPRVARPAATAITPGNPPPQLAIGVAGEQAWRLAVADDADVRSCWVAESRCAEATSAGIQSL
jgi:predicted MFS family arabinose efflux permease